MQYIWSQPLLNQMIELRYSYRIVIWISMTDVVIVDTFCSSFEISIAVMEASSTYFDWWTWHIFRNKYGRRYITNHQNAEQHRRDVLFHAFDICLPCSHQGYSWKFVTLVEGFMYMSNLNDGCYLVIARYFMVLCSIFQIQFQFRWFL